MNERVSRTRRVSGASADVTTNLQKHPRMKMRVEWSAENARINLIELQISFETAARVFLDTHALIH